MNKDLFLWLGGGWLLLAGFGHSWGRQATFARRDVVPLAPLNCVQPG
jgi:hypothetical protein